MLFYLNALVFNIMHKSSLLPKCLAWLDFFFSPIPLTDHYDSGTYIIATKNEKAQI